MLRADPADIQFVRDAFWIVIGRAASPVELEDTVRPFDPHTRHVLIMRLLTAVESGELRADWQNGRARPDGDALERGLRSLGPDSVFVMRAYECLLERPADPDGFGHYTQALARGESRTSVLRSLARSEEFERHYREVAPQNRVMPKDVQLCELANPAKWDNPEWMALLNDLQLTDGKPSMHRKSYEFTQLVYGCKRLGALREDATFVSIGAGREVVLYWLANHVKRVVATDMYEGVWQDVQSREGDPDVLERPGDYAPFSYRRDHLTFMKMDGRRLGFRDNAFDVAYSLSSIEHFGGVPGASETVHEMGRIVKPGGLVAVATEYVISGPPHEETFQSDEFAEVVNQPGLELVQPFDDRVYHRYDYAAVDLYRNPYQTPHMVVRFNDTVFTTAMVFLRKGG